MLSSDYSGQSAAYSWGKREKEVFRSGRI